MSTFNQNKFKEGILWCLFFLVTFFVGYYHGSSPETQLSYHYIPVKTIDLLTFDTQSLSRGFIDYIEKETHSKINIVQKNNYELYRTELIINKNIAIALVPENFVQPFQKDNRIKNLELLKTEIEKQNHFDFMPQVLDGKIYSLPILWFINVFKNLNPKNTKPKTFEIIGDVQLINIKKFHPKWNFNEKAKIIFRQISELSDQNTSSSDFAEMTLQQAEINQINYQLDPDWSTLKVYSFVIPNNTPDKELSFRFLQMILNDPKAKRLLYNQNYGFTWKSLNGIDFNIFNSPESLRNINLNNFNPSYTSFNEKLWKN